MPAKSSDSPSNEVSQDARVMGYVGRQPGTEPDRNAWFTPSKYMDSARKVLGGRFVLDPFSSDEANAKVKADVYFTEQDDAFKQDWKKAIDKKMRRLPEGTIRSCWMNPPYSGALCSAAVFRFIEEYNGSKHDGERAFDAGIFLVNNATETKWFQEALKWATAICLTDHRISFWKADEKAVSGNTRGQAFLYFGPNAAAFKKEFSQHGHVVLLHRGKPRRPLKTDAS